MTGEPWREQPLWGAALLGSIMVMASGLFTPILPDLISPLNTTQEAIGWVLSAYTLPSILLGIPFGALSDKYGRKTVLYPCLIVFNLSAFIQPYVPDFTTLIILRFIQGLGYAGIMPTSFTILGDLFEEARLTKALSFYFIFMNLSLVSWPFIGGVLAETNWRLSILAQTVAIPISVLIVYLLKAHPNIAVHPHEPTASENKGPTSNSGTGTTTFLDVLKIPHIRVALFSSLSSFIILFGIFFTYFPFFLAFQFSADPAIRGALLSFGTLITAIFTSQVPRITKKVGYFMTLSIGYFTVALSYLIIPTIPELIWIILPVIIHGTGIAVITPIQDAIVLDYSPTKHRAKAESTNQTIIDVGKTFGPLLFGSIMGLIAINLLFWIGSGVCLILCVIFTLSSRRLTAKSKTNM